MVFGIKVYEKDEYLYSLIKARLQKRFPQAYISRFDDEGFRFTDNIKVIYDNKQFESNSLDTNSSLKAIPLYENNVIDIRRIAKLIEDNHASDNNVDFATFEEQVKLLVSFSYIDEREHFINEVLGPDSFNAMHPIRIDLMSGIRMPRGFSSISCGALSNLLRACTDKRFNPEQILEYLGPSSSGFLSPGKPVNEDDVFDIGINASAHLMELTKKLCQKMSSGALFVAEGWRVNEIFELIAKCDSLHILLPARMCTEDTGMTNELQFFQRSLKPGSKMTVHYYEDYKDSKKPEINYESIRI